MKKKDLHRNVSKLAGAILLAFLLASPLSAQTEKVKTIEKIFDGKTALWVSHRYGELVIKRGTGSQIKAILTIKATGKNQEETQQFLDKLDLSGSDGSDNKLDLKSVSNIKTWNKIAGKSTVKFKDGSSVSGIEDFDMRLELYVPKLRYATLDNAYETTTVEEGTADLLEIKQYEGKVEAPGNFDQLKLDIKYAKANIGNFNQCTAEVYTSTIALGNGRHLEIDSKYSGFKIGTLQNCTLTAYEDNYKIEAVNNALKINSKYATFAVSGNLGNANLTLYETKLEAKNGIDIEVSDSKYSKYHFQELNSLHFKSSYEDDIHLEKVGSLWANSSKYSEYIIAGLWKEMQFPSSYEDAISVTTVGGTFEGLTLDGKYTRLSMPIPAAVKFELDVTMVYGKITYPESSMETTIYKEKEEHITLKAKSKGAGADAAKVVIKSYEGKIKLD